MRGILTGRPVSLHPESSCGVAGLKKMRWSALGLLVFLVPLRSWAELVYIDPLGFQTKLNGFSAAEVGYNITRTRVVSDDDSAYTYDSKNALSKPAREDTAISAPTKIGRAHV